MQAKRNHPSDAATRADRRPIRSRDLRIWRWAAGRLAVWGVPPNAISVAGMFFGVVAGGCLAATPFAGAWERAFWILAALFVQARLICNMLDGMVAIARGAASPLGELYNEAPDRVSDLAGLVGLGYASTSVPMLGWFAGALAVMVAYVRAAARAAGAPQDYRGPMAKQERMFVVTLVSLFMGLAPAAMKPTIAENGWSVPSAGLVLIAVGCVVTMIRRLARAARSLRVNPPRQH
jgi:phosphatidylglycerophosphate synthase